MLVTWSVPLSWLDSIPLHPVGDARDSQHPGAALLHNVKVKCGFSQKPAQMNCPPGSVENNAALVGLGSEENNKPTGWSDWCAALGNREKQVIPEEKKENKTTEMQSQMQSMDQVNLPGEGEPQASTDASPGSDTSCPLKMTGPTGATGTTDFQKHTEVATTTEMFIFAVKYQIAALGNREKQVIPEEKKENKTTEMQSQMQSMDQVNLPGEGEPQASTDAPPGSDTSCPLKMTGPTGATGTTDFQKHTEVATTTETFIFAVKYQIAGGRVEEQSRKPRVLRSQEQPTEVMEHK
ncbi:interleukin-2 receptor subunit alpha-like [Manis javanica]|uniref:interleukin-2 receptor subunit alpha-like n=1 Tax=Manis javanica TaxID=9974 RepID=UPI003C6CE33B